MHLATDGLNIKNEWLEDTDEPDSSLEAEDVLAGSVSPASTCVCVCFIFFCMSPVGTAGAILPKKPLYFLFFYSYFEQNRDMFLYS